PTLMLPPAPRRSAGWRATCPRTTRRCPRGSAPPARGAGWAAAWGGGWGAGRRPGRWGRGDVRRVRRRGRRAGQRPRAAAGGLVTQHLTADDAAALAQPVHAPATPLR